MADNNGPMGIHHPSLRPLWRRIAVVAACVGWFFVELSLGNPYWGAAILAVGIWAAYQFFINFPKDEN